MKAIVDIETTGLNPLKDKIIAIGILFFNGVEGDEKVAILNGHNAEKAMLMDFWKRLVDKKVEEIYGFNFEFDWTFLKLRSLKYRVSIKQFTNKTWLKEAKWFDLRLILNSNRYMKGTKLCDYLAFLDIENGDKFCGADVPQLYEEGKIDEILSHLEHDIWGTYMLYKVMKGCGLVD